MAAGWINPEPLRVPRRLLPYVRKICGYAATGLTPGVHRGLPSSLLTMVLPIGDPLRTAPSWQAWRRGDVDRQSVILGGLHTTSALVLQPAAWAGIQLALSPLGARSLFGAPASALPTAQWDGREVLGSVADEVAERLGQAADWPERYRVAVAFLDTLARRSESRARVRPEVRRAWEVVQHRRGDVGVAEVADDVGLGPRRLSTLFAAEFGLTPKVAARLARFDGARMAVADAAVASSTHQSLDLSRIAIESGYYDHAHLVRDFAAFAGVSPTAWIDEEFRNVQAGVELHEAASTS